MQKTKNLSYGILISIYVFINALFIYKYGQRQNVVTPLFLLLIYSILIGSLIIFFQKISDNISLKKTTLSTLYWIITGVVFVIFSFVVFNIDGESLNVDRWSAMELMVQGITEGKYPYSRIDHLGNMSSNFPALGYIALPFYLLGDIGYLQVFTFLLFSFFLYKTCSKKTTSFFILFLFLFSPALIWEIIVKSDLVSNIMLVFLFVEYWAKKYAGNLLQKPILLGAIIAFFLLTRGVVIIPLIIFFSKDFWVSKTSTKIKVIASTVLMSLLICLPIILSVPDWDTFINNNPLSLQTNKTPLLSYSLLCVLFVIPYITGKHNDYIFYSALIIFTIPFISMMSSINQTGWHSTFFEHKFDISYLSMAIPPILLWLKNKNYK